MKKSFILYGILAVAFISSAAIYNSYQQSTTISQEVTVKNAQSKVKSKPVNPVVAEMLKDLKSASKKLSKLKECKFNNKVDITVSDSTGTISETSSKSSVLVKKDKNIFFHQGNIKRIQNEDYNIMIIPDEKIVVLNNADKSIEDYFGFFNSRQNMDSLASNIENINKEVNAAGEKIYTYTFGYNKTIRYALTIGVDGIIKKLSTTKPLYIEKTGNTLVNTITYSCKSVPFEQNDFFALDIKNTLIREGKKLSLVKKYEGYTLHDNRLKK